jgi:hypothetical protein
VDLSDALKTDVEVDSYKPGVPLDAKAAATLDDQYRRESARDPNAAVAAVAPRPLKVPTLGSHDRRRSEKHSARHHSHHEKKTEDEDGGRRFSPRAAPTRCPCSTGPAT